MKEMLSLFLLVASISAPIKIALTSYSQLETVSTILGVGTPLVNGSFCFDAQADTIWVRGNDCQNCQKQGIYECTSSSTCYPQSPDQIINENYTLKGTMVSDTIDFNVFRFNLSFLEVLEEDGQAPKLDGCIALGMKGYSNPEHFIHKLLDSKLIDKAIVGFNLDGKTECNIMLGGYDSKYVKKSQQLLWFDMSDDWSIPLVDISISTYHSGSTKIKILTQFGSIVVPTGAYDTIMSIIKANKQCYYNQCTIIEADYIYLKPIYLKVNEKTTWKIDYRYYTKEVRTYRKLSYCDQRGCHYIEYLVFEITLVEGTDSWGLGGEGLQHFYTIFDYDNNKLGVYYKGLPLNQSVVIMIVVFSVFGAGAISIGAVLIVRCVKKKDRLKGAHHL